MTSPQLTSYSIMKAEGFFSKSRNKIRVLTLTILFNQNLFTGKMNKILYSVCRRYSIVLKSTVHTQKKLFETYQFSKVADTKINTHKSILFLYNKNELSERL